MAQSKREASESRCIVQPSSSLLGLLNRLNNDRPHRGKAAAGEGKIIHD